MLAALRLHHLTGDEQMLGLTSVLCACLFDNVGLWSTSYGHARDRASFFGVFPMPGAPYTAAYEQAEVSAACAELITRAGDELSAPMTVLLPELIRHVTARLDTYYPDNIPEEALVDSPKTGHIIKHLSIPVEDLADGWDEAGSVGQEVYGAGIAFSTLARSYIRVPERTTQIYCEYPYSRLRCDREQVELRIHGDHRLQARLRVLVDDEAMAVEHVRGSSSGEIEVADEDAGWREYWVSAGQDLTITFD
jgi:hypothetical protein